VNKAMRMRKVMDYVREREFVASAPEKGKEMIIDLYLDAIACAPAIQPSPCE
jgi:hypothetical protein